MAERHQVSRDEQDEFALASHQRAVKADENQTLSSEIEPIEVPTNHRGRERHLALVDEGPRPDTSLEALAKLSPVFKADGTVTAGQFVTDERWRQRPPPGYRSGTRPIWTHTAGANRLVRRGRRSSGCDGGWHGPRQREGPGASGLGRSGISRLAEVNEAFASQAVATVRLLGLDPGSST